MFPNEALLYRHVLPFVKQIDPVVMSIKKGLVVKKLNMTFYHRNVLKVLDFLVYECITLRVRTDVNCAFLFL